MRVLFATFGVGVLATLVARIGPANLAAQLSVLRWCLPVLAALGLVKLSLRTWSWSLALRAEGAPLSFGRLLAARIVSQSAGYLTWMGPLVTEGMSPVLLRRWAPLEAAASASLAETSTYWLTSVLFGLAGTITGIFLAPTGSGLATISIVTASVFGLASLLLFMRTPVVPTLGNLLCRWNGEGHGWCAWIRKAEPVERRMRWFRWRHPGVARRMFVLDLLVQVAMLAEVIAVLTVVSLHLGFLTVLALEASMRMLKIATFYVPGRVGIDEAGATGVFLLFGLTPAAGFTLAIARRVQALIWVVGGLAWFAFTEFRSPREESLHANPAIAARNS